MSRLSEVPKVQGDSINMGVTLLDWILYYTIIKMMVYKFSVLSISVFQMAHTSSNVPSENVLSCHLNVGSVHKLIFLELYGSLHCIWSVNLKIATQSIFRKEVFGEAILTILLVYMFSRKDLLQLDSRTVRLVKNLVLRLLCFSINNSVLSQ